MTRKYTLDAAQMTLVEWILSNLDDRTVACHIEEQLNYQDECSEYCTEFYTEHQLLNAYANLVEAVDTSGES